jgi:hypothetical protein
MTIEKRLRLIVERKFPTGGLCYRLQRKVKEAQKIRLGKMQKAIEGLKQDEIETKIKEWENDT